MLHLVCGKIGAGKSTLVDALIEQPATIAVREDDWLDALYPGEQNTLDDYVRNAARLKTVMGPHLVTLLRHGLSVALDFPANTLANRAWMRGVAEQAGVPARLHWLDVPDAVCLERLHRRNASGTHPFQVSDADFALFTRYFVPPTPEEGLEIIRHPG